MLSFTSPSPFISKMSWNNIIKISVLSVRSFSIWSMRNFNKNIRLLLQLKISFGWHDCVFWPEPAPVSSPGSLYSRWCCWVNWDAPVRRWAIPRCSAASPRSSAAPAGWADICAVSPSLPWEVPDAAAAAAQTLEAPPHCRDPSHSEPELPGTDPQTSPCSIRDWKIIRFWIYYNYLHIIWKHYSILWVNALKWYTCMSLKENKSHVQVIFPQNNV